MKALDGLTRANKLERAREYREASLRLIEEQIQFVEEDDLDPYYFSFCNHTIIDWGKIVHVDQFHTTSQLYPLGFKCIRKEHDVELDVIVDCLCEIDAICTMHSGNKEYFSELIDEDKTVILLNTELKELTPIFRISVKWIVEDRPIVKTYEALSPQQTWQSILLETVGIDGCQNEEFIASQEHVEEELQLRAKILEQRRLYFRNMRNAQSLGLIEAIRPRIQVDAVDNIFDHSILRFVEGMAGVESCRKYQLLEDRSPDSYERQIIYEYTNMQNKARNLEKLVKKMIVNETFAKMQAFKQQKIDEMEAKRRSEAQIREFRNSVLAAQKIRNQKVREIEKNVSNLKLNRSKMIKQRKDEIKNGLEAYVEYDMRTKLRRVVPNNVTEILRHPSPSKIFLNNVDNDLMELLRFWEFSKVYNLQDEGSFMEFFSSWSAFHPLLLSLETERDQNLSEHNFFLESFSANLCGLLRKPFEHIMGIDAAEFQLGGLQIPINMYNWREILKIVLTAKCCKIVGVSESDISSLVKARGFFTSPESADRKALKLARKRILYNYTVRSELQETACGFQDYFVVCFHSLNSVPINFEQSVNYVDVKDNCLMEGECPLWLVWRINEYLQSNHSVSISMSELKELCGRKIADHSYGLMFRDLLSCIPNFDKTTKPVLDIILFSQRHATVKEETVSNDLDEETDLNEVATETQSSYVVEDSSLLDVLPTMLKRCWLVVDGILNHSQSSALLNLGQKNNTPSYYRNAKLPLNLLEVKEFLAHGQYLSIYQFYSDMVLMFENVISFHPENSPYRASALKLQIVFERLFYEMVISCECPLPGTWCCHSCRSPDDMENSKLAICERCEATHHIYCLSPPLSSPPRAEWLCPSCVEQKGIASAHPLRLYRVKHPSSAVEGEIVAIDQCCGNLVFTIDFGYAREKWAVSKVRSNIIIDIGEQNTFPSDAEYEDYDKVSAIIKAYTGYGGSRSQIHPILAKEMSICAESVSSDPEYSLFTEVIKLLSQDPKAFTSNEWSLILRAIIASSMDQLSQVNSFRVNEETNKDSPQLKKSLLDPVDSVDDAVTSLDEPLTIPECNAQNLVKGMEDALFTHELLKEVSETLELNVEQEIEAVREELGDFQMQLAPSLLKSIVTLPEDENFSESWSRGYEIKMGNENPDNSGARLCEYCSLPESFICSPLVYTLSSEKWIEHFHSKNLPKEKQSERRDGFCYTPIDYPGSEIKYCDGTNIVHEYCAKAVDSIRVEFMKHQEDTLTKQFAEKLESIGKISNTFVGRDRNNNHYWILHHCNCLLLRSFVSSTYFEEESTNTLYTEFSEIREVYRVLDPSIKAENQLRVAIRYEWPQVDATNEVEGDEKCSVIVGEHDGNDKELDPVVSFSSSSFISLLKNLNASNFINQIGRHCGFRDLPNISRRDFNHVNSIKAALLLVEAALPCGAIDESEERWGNDFVIPWRDAVMTSNDATALMQCQIMLEYGIKTSWLKPTGLKLLSCLHSRIQALRTASFGSVALRLWVLDMTIKYDKLPESLTKECKK